MCREDGSETVLETSEPNEGLELLSLQPSWETLNLPTSGRGALRRSSSLAFYSPPPLVLFFLTLLKFSTCFNSAGDARRCC